MTDTPLDRPLLCRNCAVPINDGHPHLHADQCVKALKISLASYKNVLLQQSHDLVDIEGKRRNYREILVAAALQAGGQLLVRRPAPKDGGYKLRVKWEEALESHAVTTEYLSPEPPADAPKIIAAA